jgi:hypothetical protein
LACFSLSFSTEVLLKSRDAMPVFYVMERSEPTQRKAIFIACVER